jgi:hypothetical protein
MRTSTLRRLLAATAAAAILTAIMPVLPDRFHAANPFDASSASARNGSDDSGSRGGGGDDSGSGGGNSGPGGGDDSGHGGDDGGGDDNSGPGGDDGGDDDNSGPGGDDNRGPGGGGDDGDGADDDGHDDDFGRRDGHHIDAATGAKIEVEGGKIEIVYPDGWKEELENGIFELKDPSGRTVIERRATREDVARLRAIVN